MYSPRDTLSGGLPHSEIPGSPIARISPGLFAACHVLHRLSVPRHPPDALLFALDHRIAVTGDAAPPPRTGPSPSAQRSPRAPALPVPCPRRSCPSPGGLLHLPLGATFAAPHTAASMKTLLSDTSGASFARAAPTGEAALRRKGGPNAACPRPVRLGHITTLSSPFNQRPAAVARGGVAQASPNVAHALAFGASRCRSAAPVGRQSLALPVVEVNGFEPMTSCLQSRRSPS